MRYALHRPTALVRIALLAALGVLGAAGVGLGPPGRAAAGPGPLRPVDEARLREFRRLSESYGDSIWRGYGTPPYQLLLVTGDGEYLLWSNRPPDGFDDAGRAESLDSPIYRRDRVFPTRFLATFPAVGGISTIVVGPAESTAVKTSTPWIVTLLHERFHQYQYASPGYQERVAALDLDGGDSTGMWMLQYPFPYDSVSVGRDFGAACRALAGALESHDGHRRAAVDAYLAARATLREGLAPADLRYMDFQIWQEGVARYTEIAFARLASGRPRPKRLASELGDLTPYADEASRIEERVVAELRDASLRERGRVAFYALGAGEALLLDRLSSGWRSRYREGPLSLQPFFARLASR